MTDKELVDAIREKLAGDNILQWRGTGGLLSEAANRIERLSGESAFTKNGDLYAKVRCVVCGRPWSNRPTEVICAQYSPALTEDGNHNGGT